MAAVASATNGTSTSLKREAESENENETAAKKVKEDPKTPREEALSNLQYRHIPYQEQLNKKQAEVDAIVKDFQKTFVKRYPLHSKWFSSVYLERFKLDTILTSPKTFAYRNKAEFTIGYNPELNKLCAGPRISDGENGRVQVGPCDQDLVHLPPSFIDIAQDFSNNFLDKWNYLEETCPFRNLFIRVTKTGDHMIMVIIGVEETEKLKELKNEIVKYYTDDYDKKHNIKSIYVQSKPVGSTKRNYQLDFLHAHGEEFLVDDILDLKLVVTPDIYFRINTFAAEITFQKIIDVGDLKKRSTLVIDLWCGCGVLALLMAKKAAHVIGIDPSKWNIKKANQMAKYNKLRSIEFIISPVEEGLRKIWDKIMMAEEVVIIAEPPTLCKMYDLSECIARIPHLKRFIYIYSSHKLHLRKNLMSLTRASLLPTRVIPVDSAPHNIRLETIFCLRKLDPNAETLPPSMGGGIPPIRGVIPPIRGVGRGIDDRAYIEEIERRAYERGIQRALEEEARAAAAMRYREPLVDDYDYRGASSDGWGSSDRRGAGGYGGGVSSGGFGGGGVIPSGRERSSVVPPTRERGGYNAGGFDKGGRGFSNGVSGSNRTGRSAGAVGSGFMKEEFGSGYGGDRFGKSGFGQEDFGFGDDSYESPRGTAGGFGNERGVSGSGYGGASTRGFGGAGSGGYGNERGVSGGRGGGYGNERGESAGGYGGASTRGFGGAGSGGYGNERGASGGSVRAFGSGYGNTSSRGGVSSGGGYGSGYGGRITTEANFPGPKRGGRGGVASRGRNW